VTQKTPSILRIFLLCNLVVKKGRLVVKKGHCCKNHEFSCNSEIMERETIGCHLQERLLAAAKSSNLVFTHDVWQRRVLELPHRLSLGGYFEGGFW